MDSLDLLAREDEFKKLNKQLEKKTEKLIKEIEYAMQKPDFFLEIPHNLSLTQNHIQVKKHCCEEPKILSPVPIAQNRPKIGKRTPTRLSPKETTNSNSVTKSPAYSNDNAYKDCDTNCSNTTTHANKINCDCCAMSRNDVDLNFLYAFISVNVQDKVLPNSFLKDKITVEGLCKFLSSKVKLMQEQINKLQSTIDTKKSQCERHLTHQAELESERMSLLNKGNNLKAEAAELKAKYLAMQNRFNEKDRLYKEQRSETDKLSAEVIRLRSKLANVEARFGSQDETIEHLKQQLENSKRAEKELRDSTRSLSASHQSAISQLEAKTKSLTFCIDKQNMLIGNLKKQNALLCANGSLKLLEKEFNELLNKDF